jgi:hypothetical protein
MEDIFFIYFPKINLTFHLNFFYLEADDAFKLLKKGFSKNRKKIKKNKSSGWKAG